MKKILTEKQYSFAKKKTATEKYQCKMQALLVTTYNYLIIIKAVSVRLMIQAFNQDIAYMSYLH